MKDETWKRAMDCAFAQFEGYVKRRETMTPEQRRTALDDAFQHAFGIIEVARMQEDFMHDIAQSIADGRRSDPTPVVVDTDIEARRLYTADCDNHPTIHSNRFATWDELSEPQRAVWRIRAHARR